MSIKSIFPEVKPSLNLDFANTKQLDPRITFSRATFGTYYDGKTFAKAEENLLTYSQEFDNALWLKESVTCTANGTTAPDGTSTADVLVEDSATSWHRYQQQVKATGSSVFSCFAKPNTGSRYLVIGVAVNGGDAITATFDLSTGLLTSSHNSGGTLSILATDVFPSVNGWRRFTLAFTTTATIEAAYIGLSSTSAFSSGSRGFNTYAGSTSNSIYIWGAQLEQRSTVTAYTPTTSQPITNYIPVLMTAPAGVARFDHVPADNPITGAKQGESLGLLIEESRANLLKYSSDFGNAAWNKVYCSVAADVAIAPDGTQTADKAIASVGTNQKQINHSVYPVGLTVGEKYTFSVYLKAGEHTFATLYIQGAGTSGFVSFNLATGVPGAGGTMVPVGNGWYRCSISGTASATTGYPIIYFALSDTVGDGFKGFYIWGAQLEAGSFATSYIPTVASQVTRAADAASMTGSNFSSWYRQDEGTLYLESVNSGGVTGGTFTVNDGTERNRIFVQSDTRTDMFAAMVSANSVMQSSLTLSGAAALTPNKVAMAYRINDLAATRMGGSVVTDASSLIPGVSRAIFNAVSSEAAAVNSGWIRKVSYYPKRLTNAQLQALTA